MCRTFPAWFDGYGWHIHFCKELICLPWKNVYSPELFSFSHWILWFHLVKNQAMIDFDFADHLKAKFQFLLQYYYIICFFPQKKNKNKIPRRLVYNFSWLSLIIVNSALHWRWIFVFIAGWHVAETWWCYLNISWPYDRMLTWTFMLYKIFLFQPPNAVWRSKQQKSDVAKYLRTKNGSTKNAAIKDMNCGNFLIKNIEIL